MVSVEEFYLLGIELHLHLRQLFLHDALGFLPVLAHEDGVVRITAVDAAQTGEALVNVIEDHVGKP